MRTLTGKVISTKMIETATVLVESSFLHPLYHKVVRRHKKYHADNKLGAKDGESVKIRECRPISKTKKWQVIKVLGKS